MTEAFTNASSDLKGIAHGLPWMKKTNADKVMYPKKKRYLIVNRMSLRTEYMVAHGKISGLPSPGVFVPKVMLGTKRRKAKSLRKKPNAVGFYPPSAPAYASCL